MRTEKEIRERIEKRLSEERKHIDLALKTRSSGAIDKAQTHRRIGALKLKIAEELKWVLNETE